MIRIGICDDSVEQGKLLEKHLHEYMRSVYAEYECMLFQSSRALLYEIESKTNFDILFLDIEMPEENGIELTKQIRQWQPEILVIFVSAYEKYVYDSFQVQPYRFIPKGQMEKLLFPALEDAVRETIRLENQFYVAKNQQGIEKIPLKEIVYIWHREKYAYIQKRNGECIKVRKTLKQVYDELPQEVFIWIERGYICNLSYIESIKGDIVKLSTGVELQSSRDRVTAVKNQVRRYWLRESLQVTERRGG